MSVFEQDGRWRYRRVIRLPDGSKTRIFGTAEINSAFEAKNAETAHVMRLLNRKPDEPIHVPVLGPPVTFHVTAIYGNGARRDVAAVSLTNDSGYLPGVGYQTDDGEFLIFVAHCPVPQTEEWQFDPETDIPREGVPF